MPKTKTSSSKSTLSKKVTKKTTNNKEKNTGMAVLAYILFFIPLLTDAKDDPFVKFHVKQSLALLIMIVASWVIGIVPIIGWIIAFLTPLLVLVLWIIGVINAASGKQKPLPLIGELAEKIEI